MADHAERMARLKGYQEGLLAAADFADTIAKPLREASELYGVHGPNRETIAVAENIARSCRSMAGQ